MESPFGAALEEFMGQPLAMEPLSHDPEAPLGTPRRPLGNPEHAARSYLLGLRCTCGTTSLAYSQSFEENVGVHCPKCQASLG